MRKTCFSICFLFVLLAQCHLAFGQQAVEAEYDDRLYLKDGSIFKGRLLHIIHGESYWFEISSGDTLVYPVRKVKRLIQDADAYDELPGNGWKPRPYAFRETGLYFSTMGSLGLGRDFSGFSTGNVGLSFSAGYQLNRWIGLGGGVGVDVYQPEEGQVVYPLFAEARGYLTGQKVAPYYSLRLGYGMAFEGDNNNIIRARGGLLVHPAIGMRWGAGPGVNFVSDMGFQYQESSFTFANFNGELTHDLGYKRLVFRVGIVF